MSELIKREDAIEAMAELQGIAQSKAELTGISKAWKRIKVLHTVDAVPVVRCKECKWFDREEQNHPCGYCHAAKHGYMTSRWEISIYRKCKEDFYCADGERKDGEG